MCMENYNIDLSSGSCYSGNSNDNENDQTEYFRLLNSTLEVSDALQIENM